MGLRLGWQPILLAMLQEGHFPGKIVVYYEHERPDFDHEKIEWRNLFDDKECVALCAWTLPVPFFHGAMPDGDYNYSTRWSAIKRYFSTGCVGAEHIISESRRQKREKAVWQRRFWEHTIQDEEDWGRHMDYIHYNPVKHGYVTSPKDWPYSSFHRCVQLG